jgi:hypothetical protein
MIMEQLWNDDWQAENAAPVPVLPRRMSVEVTRVSAVKGARIIFLCKV